VKRIEIEWVDSASYERYWTPEHDLLNKPLTITTRGFLIRENKHTVVIASSVAKGGAPGGILTIPKLAITRREDS
jgi:hypothetical protein